MQVIQQKIQYILIADLKPHPNNPRLIRDDGFKVLCESISANKDYFETRPCLCDENMVVFAGNQRMRAAKHLGWTEVPVSIFVGISEERKRELMIRDNVQNGEYDADLLSAHYGTDELKKWGVDMKQFGVSDEPPANLTGNAPKDLKPTIKITFQNTNDLENAKVSIEELLATYDGTTLSVSAGEL